MELLTRVVRLAWQRAGLMIARPGGIQNANSLLKVQYQIHLLTIKFTYLNAPTPTPINLTLHNATTYTFLYTVVRAVRMCPVPKYASAPPQEGGRAV